MSRSTASTMATDANSWLCPLEDAHRAEGAGGKAANLGRMLDQGIAVPPGFVITDSSFQLFLDQNGLREPIAAALADIDLHIDSINAASAVIRELVVGAQVPQPVVDAMRTMLADRLPLLDQLLAVRSSAIGEDSSQAAFAGQLDSFLHIDSELSLIEALRSCWASYWSSRVLFYQHSKGIFLQGMGVVVQQLVHSRVSGILFTRSPDATQALPDTMLLEYCPGFGDKLAGGSLNPGRVMIRRHGLTWQRQAAPEGMSSQPMAEQSLEENIDRLSRIALQLEDYFDCPQDLEWTIDERGKLYVVQTRPITVACVSQPPNAQRSTQKWDVGGNTARVLWSNANVNENYPEPISPLLYSIASAGYYNYFRNLALALGFDPRRVALMEHPLRHVIGVHGARMYYNLTNIHSLLRMAPCGETLAGWFDDFVGIDQSASDEDATLLEIVRGSNWSRSLELCKTAFKSCWQFLFLGRRVARFEREVDRFAAETLPDTLAKLPMHELLQRLRLFIEIRCNRWTNAALADTAAMVTYGLLKRLLHGELQAAEHAGLHNSLLRGLGDVISGQPIVELWKLSQMVRKNPELCSLLASDDDRQILERIAGQECFAEFTTAFDEYIQNWGFRFSGELMLTSASYQENPEALLQMLRAYVKAGDESSPFSQLQRQAKEREAETAKALVRLKRRPLVGGLAWPTKATALRTVLRGCHKSIAWRERARLKQALLYSCCRRIVLAIGDKLVASDLLTSREEIFFLTYQEIDGLLAGAAMFPHQTKDLVSIRKAGHQCLAEMVPRDSFILPAGAYLPSNSAVDGLQTASTYEDTGNELVGVGACGGRVQAAAAILTDISECGLLKPGDALVARQTDPGWGPVFFLIKGLVMERGGMLSHGAILAREYGIPTVVGVRNATRRIRAGQTIEVDGDRGIVELMD